MYKVDDFKDWTIQDLINLINQITDERNYYRDKCNSYLNKLGN